MRKIVLAAMHLGGLCLVLSWLGHGRRQSGMVLRTHLTFWWSWVETASAATGPEASHALLLRLSVTNLKNGNKASTWHRMIVRIASILKELRTAPGTWHVLNQWQSRGFEFWTKGFAFWGPMRCCYLFKPLTEPIWHLDNDIYSQRGDQHEWG